MAIAEMLIWWYSQGWRVFIVGLKNWFSSVFDFFSMDSLVHTLFKPYRQISAGSTSSGSLDIRFRMFIDRLISRLIGFVSRLVLLFTGCLIMLIGSLLSLILLVLWPFIPLLPIIGLLLTIIGVTL